MDRCITKMQEIIQELKWALALETDEDMRKSRDGKEIIKYLKKAEKRAARMRKIFEKLNAKMDGGADNA